MMKIGTHNGSFHCDEALGCALLRRTEASAAFVCAVRRQAGKLPLRRPSRVRT